MNFSGKASLSFNDINIITELHNGILTTLLPSLFDKYKNIAKSYLEIIAAGCVSEELFFNKIFDYTPNMMINSSKESFTRQADGFLFHKIITNIDISPIKERFDYRILISNVTEYLNGSDFQNILIKLLKYIYFATVFGCCKKKTKITDSDIAWINKTIQEYYKK